MIEISILETDNLNRQNELRSIKDNFSAGGRSFAKLSQFLPGLTSAELFLKEGYKK